MNSLDKNYEIDRLARLCEAKDAEVEEIRTDLEIHIDRRNDSMRLLSEAQAQIAMQAEVIDKVIPFIGYSQHVPHLVEMAENVLSATSETVAAWRVKETEPLRREVAMLLYKLAEFARAYAYSHDKNIVLDLSSLDNIFNNTQATALAYEREVKAKALESAYGKSAADISQMIAELRELK